VFSGVFHICKFRESCALPLSYAAKCLLLNGVWWLDWYDLIGPAIILALVVGGAMLGARPNRTQLEEAERQELHRRTGESG
jgi:hypothetical protein